MMHVVLLGDSIFDNAVYVPDGLPVAEQVRYRLGIDPQSPGENFLRRVSLLAIDGDCIADVAQQLKRLPGDATHLFVSVGGNDTLRYAAQLQSFSGTPSQALELLATMKAEFDQKYAQLLGQIIAFNKPTTLCTIYDRCPIPDPGLRLLSFTALSLFNDCITRQATNLGWPLIDLRLVCSEPTDYSSVSPIEPSAQGGEKIARCIATVLSQHDFTQKRTVCYI